MKLETGWEPNSVALTFNFLRASRSLKIPSGLGPSATTTHPIFRSTIKVRTWETGVEGLTVKGGLGANTLTRSCNNPFSTSLEGGGNAVSESGWPQSSHRSAPSKFSVLQNGQTIMTPPRFHRN